MIEMRKIPDGQDVHATSIEVARILGLSVRSVQLMVDRGELEAWKTPGGHRRISRASVAAWMQAREFIPGVGGREDETQEAMPADTRILLIEDSVHFQNLVSLLVRQTIPHAALHIASDGISGLTMYGHIQPQLLLVDILLPGIDGATLIAGLRNTPQFSSSHLVVVTSLDEEARRPYAFALQDITVIHKSQLVQALPPLLLQLCADSPRRAS